MPPTYYHLADEPSGCPADASDFVWIVTDYAEGDYCGRGDAVGLHSDGTLHAMSNSHCSCYGFFDDYDTCSADRLKSGPGQTVSDYLRDLDDAICETPRLKRKVAELLGIVELKESL